MDHTCEHAHTFPVPCPGCNQAGAPYRPDDCPLCGGSAEIEQCARCAVWVDELTESEVAAA